MNRRLTRLARPLLCLLAASAGCGGGARTVDAGPFVAAAHRKIRPVVNGGGSVLKPMRLVVVVADNDVLGPRLKTFGDSLLGSKWWKDIGADYDLGSPEPKAVVLAGPAMNLSEALDTNSLQNYLQAAIAAAPTPPQPDGRTLYLLFIPQGGTFLYQSQVNTNCTVVRGTFHAPYGGKGDVWAPVMRCPFPAGQQEIDALTMIASRVVADAATNPGGNGWRLTIDKDTPPPQGPVWAQAEGNGTMEVGGLCGPDLREPGTATRIVEGGVTYQRVFSLSTAGAGFDPCAPSIAAPYYSVTTDSDWYEGAAGTTVTVPLKGWSLDEVDDWLVKVTLSTWSDPLVQAPNALLDGDTITVVGNITYKTINNGRSLSVRVNLPAAAKSGSWGTFVVRSFRLDSNSRTPDGEDLGHRWLLGVDVP